jgi:hypothetical protein
VLQVGGLTVYATRKVTSSSGQNERTTYPPIVCSPVRSQAKHSQRVEFANRPMNRNKMINMYQRGTFFVTGLFRFAFVLSSVCRVFVLLRLHHQQDCADAVGRWERGCRDWVGDWAGSGPADWEGDVLAAKRKARLLAFSDACTEQVRERNLSSGPFVYQK